MDSVTLAVLLVEAKACAQELSECQRPLVLMPSHMQSLARCLLDLTCACEGLHSWGLQLLVQAARREPPGDGL
jgi:hypothetical protein